LSTAKAQLNTLQSRLSSGSTDLSNDPTDPDLQILASLKEKLLTSEASVAAAKGTLGASNPKMVAEQANQASVRKQIGEATEKMLQHLKERVANTQAQIASLQTEQAQAQKTLINVQGQRDRMGQLQHDVSFRADQLNARERAAEEAKLKSKLTFSDITVLDKASPPIEPAFPKPLVVIPVGILAGLVLGLLLALLAEATDRRVRFPIDLEHSASAPFLGTLDAVRRSRPQLSASRRTLRPA
jgi:succinoglycan biosynthesis transport protein ExoP